MAEERFTGFDLYNCKNIREMFAELYRNGVYVTDKTGVKTLEVTNAQFVANQASLFGEVNDSYLEKEVKWYLTQKQNIFDMEPPIPALWASSAGHNGETNSNYGWAVYSPENSSQYSHVAAELKANPQSRRALMIYTRPSMQDDYCSDGKSDFMCTNNVQYFIRHNRLDATVSMRSNDAVFGYKCDRHWQMLVRDKLYSELVHDAYPDLKRGSIVWNVGSLHVYERHFYLVESFMNLGKHDISLKDYKELKAKYDNQAGTQ